MCVIVDANLLGPFSSRVPAKKLVMKEVYDWVDNDVGMLHFGGSKYRSELRNGPESARRLFRVWFAAGKAVRHDKSEIDRRAKQLRVSGAGNSNDHHIIAIAMISGARILCTTDKKLRQDFRNTTL